jgi:hypothetical protein
MNDREPSASDFAIANVLTQIGALSQAIGAEFELVTARMGWLVTSEAFLFAAFAASVAAYTQISQALPSLTRLLLLALPVIGIALALLVKIAIGAAHSATTRLKQQREKLLKTLPEALQIELVSSRDAEHMLGNLPPIVIPWIFVGFWVMVLGAYLLTSK